MKNTNGKKLLIASWVFLCAISFAYSLSWVIFSYFESEHKVLFKYGLLIALSMVFTYLCRSVHEIMDKKCVCTGSKKNVLIASVFITVASIAFAMAVFPKFVYPIISTGYFVIFVLSYFSIIATFTVLCSINYLYGRQGQ